MQNNTMYYSEGGLGDTLQHLPWMMANKKLHYCMMNHYKGAKELLRPLGIKPKHSFMYRNDDEKLAHLESMGRKEPMVSAIRMKYFQENPFPKQKPLFNDKKLVIGIHLCGSQYSTDSYNRTGAITKAIPADIINALSDHNIILFGLTEEIARLNLTPSSNVKTISYLDPAKSLSYVAQCDIVVAADSSIKTMSCMLKIPTFVWLADHIDHFRDTVFINPYVDDGIMETYKYKDSFKEFKKGMSATLAFIQKKNPAF
jgi:ADP-heptose:LPS heptosyltransferase